MQYTDLKTEVLEFLDRQGDPEVTARLDTILSMAESWINRKVGGYQRETPVSAVAADADGRVTLPVGFAGVRSVTQNGRPFQYAVSGPSLVIARGANGSFDIVWLMKLAPLSDANPTNWLIEAAPDAYLDACLMRAMIFLQRADAAAMYGTNAATAIEELTKQNVVAQYANASLRIPGQVP